MLNRREKSHRLNHHLEPGASPKVATALPHRRIATTGDDEGMVSMLDYAYTTCQRLKADRVILTHDLTSRGIETLAAKYRAI